MGLGRMTSNLITHSNLHQTNTPVGQYYVGAPLVLGQATGNFGLTRLTMARTRGKPPPSPIQYILHLSVKATSKWLFVSGLPKGSPETTKVETPTTLRGYNFVFRLPIGTRSEAKLQLSSRAFQQCVARHLHARKSGRFPTFRDQESNCQFDFRPSFLP